MEKRKNITIVFFIIFFSFLFAFSFETEVKADTFNDAKSLYDAYPDDVIYHDGYLYCSASGKVGTSEIRYKTIGWKATVYDGSTPVQNVYFSLGTNCKFTELPSMIVGDREYNWYRINFSNFKNSFNSAALSAMNKSSCKIILNAIMCVRIAGTDQGEIYDSSDNISKTGTVYEDYEGIKNAEDWSDTAIHDLQSRFNKEITGMYVNLTINKWNGISYTTGQGRYLIASKPKVSASAITGYTVDHWTDEAGNVISNNSTYILPSMYHDRTINVYGEEVIKWQASISKENGEICFGIDAFSYDTFMNKTSTFNSIMTEFSMTQSLNPLTWENGTSKALNFKEYGNMEAYLYTNVDNGYYNTVTYDFDGALNTLGLTDINNIPLTDRGSGARKNAQRITLPSTMEFDKEYTIKVTITRNDGRFQTQFLKLKREHLNMGDIIYRIRKQ